MPWAATLEGGPAALGGGCWAGPLGGRGGIDEFVVAAAPTVGDMDRAEDVDPVGEGVGRLTGCAGGGPPDGGGAKLSGGGGAGPSNGFCR